MRQLSRFKTDDWDGGDAVGRECGARDGELSTTANYPTGLR
jgi:hypothetical protein